MIKRLLALGLVSGLLVAGGFAISGHVNHQSSKYQVLLAKNIQNPKKEKENNNNLVAFTNLIQYSIPGSPNVYFEAGLVDSFSNDVGGDASSAVTSENTTVCAGVVNGIGATDYGQMQGNSIISSTSYASEPNVAGPNTYQAGVQQYGQTITWYNEYNNQGGVVQQSTYPLN